MTAVATRLRRKYSRFATGRRHDTPAQARQVHRSECRYPYGCACGESAVDRHPGRRRTERSGRHPPPDRGTAGRDHDGHLKLVMGNRTTRRDTWLRRLSSRVANGVRSTLLNDGTPDTGCGIKLFERDNVPAAAALQSHAPLPAGAGAARGPARYFSAGRPPAAEAGHV